MKTITLTRGMTVTVDDVAFARYGDRKWQADENGLARRKETGGGRRRDVYLHRLIAGAREGQEVRFANGDRTDYRRANLELVARSRARREASTPLMKLTHLFLRCFPAQAKFGYAATGKHLARVMEAEGLTCEAVRERILMWRDSVRDMAPWDLAKSPPVTRVDWVPTPLADLPTMVLPDEPPAERPWVRAMNTPWEDDGTA